ncbi:acyl-CoA dehydrogenase family protein [Patulibacter sp. NPDC049589]|uniref:acyl-CoA dehydrogenase family protein n=1 Tax=Patulibacter sp. NPDC049589 TaxID=3154731 RepID=UPI00342AAE4C
MATVRSTPIAPGSPELRALLDEIAAGAFERERDDVPPHDVVDRIRETRLGALRVPREHGGAGATQRELFATIVDLAHADANLAHILRAHYWFVERRRLDDGAEAGRWLRAAADGALYGNATSEVGGSRPVGDFSTDTRLADDGAGGYRLTGTKYYSTGSLYTDFVSVLAAHDDGRLAAAVVPVHRDGVTLEDDWDGIGQRLTGTGTTRLDAVAVAADEVLSREVADPPEPTYEGASLQLYLTAVVAGILRSIRDDAAALVRGRERTYAHAAAPVAAEDPQLQEVVGRIASWAFAAEATVLAAADALDAAEATVVDGVPAADAATHASLRAAEAKVLVDELAQRAGGLIFDVGGASATKRSRNLDRHWRNARTLASHNPTVYKARVIGDLTINGTPLPAVGFF